MMLCRVARYDDDEGGTRARRRLRLLRRLQSRPWIGSEVAFAIVVLMICQLSFYFGASASRSALAAFLTLAHAPIAIAPCLGSELRKIRIAFRGTINIEHPEVGVEITPFRKH